MEEKPIEDKLDVLFQEHALSSYTDGLTKAISAKGVNVNLFTMQPKRKKLEKEGVKVKHFPLSKIIWMMPNERGKRIIDNQVCYPWLLKTIKNQDIKILHLNVASKSENFLKAKEKFGTPIIYTNHYVPEPEPYEALDFKEFLLYEREKALIPRVCENSSQVVTVSEYAKKRLKEEFGIDSTVIYHGVDLKTYNPFLPKEKKSLGFEPDEKIVLWVARFGHHPYKDPFTFVRAIPLVVQQCPKTRFVMIGSGVLKPFVVDLAKKLSVCSSIKIIDYVEHLNLFYAASDVFVLTSFNDNFGLVAAEAMACGKPVIVSDSGAPQEIVGGAGLIFNYGSHHDLADKIIMLLQDGDLRQELGIKAYKKIVKNFTWEKAARNYLDIYKKVLN
jgi:glycosyltransferase involved in cell wall biosynthesis